MYYFPTSFNVKKDAFKNQCIPLTVKYMKKKAIYAIVICITISVTIELIIQFQEYQMKVVP